MYRWETVVPTRAGELVLTLSADDLARLEAQHGERNKHQVAVLCLSWTSLLGDSPITDCVKPVSCVKKFFKRLQHNLLGSIKLFSDLAYEITCSESRSEEGAIIRIFIPAMEHTPVFKEYLLWYRSGDIRALRYVLSFLQYGKKLHYDNPELEANALRDWLTTEAELKNIEVPAWATSLKKVFEWLAFDLPEFEFYPAHGKGAVAERSIKGLIAKNAKFSVSSKVEYLYLKSTHRMHDADLRWIPTPSGSSKVKITRPVARLLFVPKQYDKLRTICAEPVAHQWGQQGQRPWLEDFLAYSYLSQFIKLRSQEFNQTLCLIGSQTGRLDTIDLSDASNCVLWRLLKAVMPARITKHLAATRTSEVSLPGQREPVKLEKFAPMGSGVCFPTQCLLYAGVVLHAYICYWAGIGLEDVESFNRLDLDIVLKNLFDVPPRAGGPVLEGFGVFGDDLITDNRITIEVMRALGILGFKVNKRKSYLSPLTYRESCGKHYMSGGDVTPLTFKVSGINTEGLTAKALAGLIDHANLAADYGYQCLRRYLVRLCLYAPLDGYTVPEGMRNPILFSTDRDQSIAVYCEKAPSLSHLRSRGKTLEPFYSVSPSTIQPTPPVYGAEPPSWEYSEWPRPIGPASAWPRANAFTVKAREQWAVKPTKTHIDWQYDEVCSITVVPEKKRELPDVFDNYRYGVWWRARRFPDMETPVNFGGRTVDAQGVRFASRWTCAS